VATRRPDVGADRVMQTDEQLMLAYVRGQEGAYRELFARLAPVLLRIALRQLRRPADAQDILQQTFLQIHRARFDYDGRSKLRPWAITILLNLARDVLRRRGRWLESELDAERLPAHDAAAGRGERAETSARVRAAVACLPTPQREVIELHWFEELSFEDIGAVVGAQPGTVRVRAHRGYQTLRKALGDVLPATSATA